MMGQVNYRITEDDMVVTQHRVAALGLRRPQFYRNWVIAAAFIAVLILAISHRDLASHPFAVIGMALIAGLAWMGLTLGFCIGVAWLRRPEVARRMYRQTKSLHPEFKLSWTDEQLRWESSNGTQILPIENLFQWGQWRDEIILFASEYMFYAIPLRSFTPEHAAELSALLTRSGIPRVGPRP